MDWSKLSPDHIIAIATVIGSLATWFYHKVKGDKKVSMSSLLDDIVGNILHEFLDDYNDEPMTEYLDKARKYLDDNLWAIAQKRGIPRGLYDLLVHAAIERGTKWLADEVAKRKIPVQLQDLAAKIAKIEASFHGPLSVVPVAGKTE